MENSHICGRRREMGLNTPGRSRLPETDHYRADGACSFCGSVSQEAFLAFVEAGGVVGPTDKGYKAYLHGTEAVPAPGTKFYFQHLDEAGRQSFIELHNSRRMRIGVPGYFYTRPYFCTVESK